MDRPKELGERQIRVNALVPGAIATDFGGGVVRDNASVNEMLAGVIALGRVGEADDIGAAVVANPGRRLRQGYRHPHRAVRRPESVVRLARTRRLGGAPSGF